MTETAITSMIEEWDRKETSYTQAKPQRRCRITGGRVAIYELGGDGTWISTKDTVEVRQ